MTLETFFKKFDTFADAPDAVARMRELILQLAIQGGLVPNFTKEAPVPYLSCEGAKPVNLTDIPENWRVVLLADAIKNRSGNSKLIKGKLHNEPAEGRFQGFSASGADVWCDDYEHEGQAIIISAVGARCGKAFKASGKWCAIANTNITRPEPSLFDFDFAYLILNNEHFWVRGGSAQPFVKFPPSLTRHFALPPLAEQKRIVAKVDELMALCDSLEAQQQERDTRHAELARASLARFADTPTPANLQFLFHPNYPISPADLRKSILTLAVQGKLVPQDPNDEPAVELLARSLAERRKLKRTDAAEVPPLAPEDALGYEIPESWRWQRLDELLVFGPTNGFSPKAVDYETSVRSLTLSATTSGRFKGQHSKFITTDVPDDSDLWLHDGDILVQRGNTIEYVGVAAVYRGEPNCFVYPDLMMKLRVSAAFDVGYIHLAMSQDASRDFLRARASGTSGSMPKINQTTLKSLPLPIPPPRRTTADRGQSGSTDGLGGRVGNAPRRLPRHRQEPPTSPRGGTD